MAVGTLKLWRDRIRYGKDVMKQHGIVGFAHEGDSTMRLLIDFYRGKQWSHLHCEGIDDDEQIVANKVFQVANQFESEVSATRPDVQLLPRGGVIGKEVMQAAAERARIVQPLISYDIDELDMETQMNDALVDHFFAPFGCVRHGFTPREEVFADDEKTTRLNWFRHERPDRPFVRRVAPWDVVVDPNAARFHPDGGMKWVAFRTIQTLAQIKANPNIVNKKGLKDLAGNVAHPFQPLLTGRAQRGANREDPDTKTYIEVYTVYESDTRTWCQFTLDGLDTYLRAPDDWPIPWEWLPVNFFSVNQQRDTPFAVPMMATVRPIQEELNKLRTQMSWLVGNIRRLIAIHKDGMEESEKRKLETAWLTEILETTGSPEEAIKVIQSGGLPQELLAYEALLEEECRENLGLSKMGRGQRINVESAEEAHHVQSGQDVNVSRAVRHYEKFWKDMLTLYLQARRATFDPQSPEVFPLVGQVDEDGLQRWVQVGAEELHGDYDFHIVPGSTRQRNRFEEERRWVGRLQLALELKDVFNVSFYAQKVAEIQGVSPEEALQQFAKTASAVQGLDQVRRNAAPGGEAAAGGGDGGAGNLAAIFGQNGGGAQ